MKRTLPFLTLLFMSFTTLKAQDSTTLLKDLIITENRLRAPFSQISRNIDILTQKDIQAAPVNSVAELLNYVAGVDVRQRGVQGIQPDITIRGSTFDQILILINGAKFSDPQSGHHTMNLPVDIQNIERIEILKGPSARIYGQNAYAGAINIVTKQNTERGTSATFQAGDYALLGGNVTSSLPIGNVLQTVSLSYNESKGYRPNSDYKIGNIFYQNQVKLGETKLNFLGGYNQRGFGASGFYNSTNTSNEREYIQTNFVSADMPFQIGALKLIPRLTWRRGQDNYFFNFLNDSTQRATQNFTLTQVLNGEINGHFDNKLGTTGIGVEYNSIQYFNKRLGDHNRKVFSAFFEHRFKFLNNRIDLTPGLLYANYSDFGSNIFPGIDLGVSITENLKFYSNYGKTFRVPTYTDLYFFNAANKNNPNLQPEKADVYEAGLRFINKNWTVQAAYFSRTSNGLIDRTRNETTEPWTPNNSNSLILRGYEASAIYRFQALNTGHFQLSYVNLHDYEFTKVQKLSRYALDFLTDQFSASFESGIIGKLRQNIRLRYNKRLNQLENYTVVDAKLMWQGEKITIFMQASNLFDTVYTEQNNIPLPLRWFSTGLIYRFKH